MMATASLVFGFGRRPDPGVVASQWEATTRHATQPRNELHDTP
jgi:hypothetical protein